MQPRTPCGMGLRGANKEFYHAATHLMYWHRVRRHLVGRIVTLVRTLLQVCLAASPRLLKIGFAIGRSALRPLDLCREEGGLTSGLRVECSLQEFSRTRTSQELIAFHNHAPARQHSVGHARNLNSFEHRIIDAHVVSLRTDGVLAVRIEDHEIRVTAHCDRALARIQAEKFCGCCGNQFHKTVHAESSLSNTAGIDEAHAVLDSGTAIRNLREIVAAQFLLLFETEG